MTVPSDTMAARVSPGPPAQPGTDSVLIEALYNNSSLMMGVIQLEGADVRFLSVNRALMKFFRISEIPREGSLASESGCPRDRVAHWIKSAHEAEHTGRSVEFEFNFQEYGRPYHFRVTLDPLPGTAGERRRFAFVIQDQTKLTLQRQEAVQAHDLLYEEKEKFNLISSHIGDVIWMTDATKNQMVYISPAYEKVWERSIQSLYEKPMSFVEAIHPEDRERVMRALSDQMSGNYHESYRLLTPNGRVKWILDRAFPIRNERGEVFRVVGIATDITDKHLSDQVIRQQKELYERVVNNIPIMLSIYDEQGRFEWANPEWSRIFGWSAQEARSGADLIAEMVPDPAERARVIEYMQEAAPEWREFSYRNRDGKLLETSWTNVKLSNGKRLGIGTDISTRKQQERLIRDQQLRMASASKMSSLGKMAGGIAHEINNPLSIIVGLSEILESKAEAGNVDPEELKRNLAKIRTTVKRIDKIIRGLRSFAREGWGDPVEDVSIAQLLSDTLEMCRSKIDHHGVELRLLPKELDPQLRMECKPVQITQVLLNLLHNSVDAIRGKPDPWVEVSIEDCGTQIEIRVTDSGTGIPAEIARHLTEPFFTTKESGQGTGLSLSISNGIVSAHGGVFGYEERSGHTSFRMRLPKKAGQRLK